MIRTLRSFLVLLLIPTITVIFAQASTVQVKKRVPVHPLQLRTPNPSFPPQPSSCPICEEHYYDSIANCPDAIAAFQDPQQIIFNPIAFIAILRCGCTDVFQNVFPECADCFAKTNQTEALGMPNLPGALKGMRQVCALLGSLFAGSSSTLLGTDINLSTYPSTLLPTGTDSVPVQVTPSPTTGGGGDIPLISQTFTGVLPTDTSDGTSSAAIGKPISLFTLLGLILPWIL